MSENWNKRGLLFVFLSLIILPVSSIFGYTYYTRESNYLIPTDTSVKNIYVIPIDFKDVRYSDFISWLYSFSAKLPISNWRVTQQFGGCTVKDFYEKASFGKYSPNFIIIYNNSNNLVNPIRLNKPLSYYGKNALTYGNTTFFDPDKTDVNKEKLFIELLNLLGSHNFSTNLKIKYPEDIGSKIKTIMIVYPTAGELFTNNSSDIFPQAWFGYPFYPNKYINLMLIPYNASVEIIVHELGHTLGLLDLYGNKYSNRGLIMTPMALLRLVNFLSIEKYWLGWYNSSQMLIFTNGSAEIKLYPVDQCINGKFHLVMIPIDNYSFYFVEYRRNCSEAIIDNNMPRSGVFIYLFNMSLKEPHSLFAGKIIKYLEIIDHSCIKSIDSYLINVRIIDKNFVELEIIDKNKAPNKALMRLCEIYLPYIISLLVIMLLAIIVRNKLRE